MRLTILELPASYGWPDSVLAEIDTQLAAGPATDLVVVPEAALHGYVSPQGDFDLTPFAERLNGETASAAATLARARGVHLVVSLVLREDSGLYNAMVGFSPHGGVSFVYRKRHPWIPETWATPGIEPPPVVSIAGRQVTIAICFDIHFVHRDAATQLTAADVLLFPSAWVENPPDTRVALMRRLAKRFDVHIANANWGPGIVRLPGQGGSCVVAPDGTVTTPNFSGRIDVTL